MTIDLKKDVGGDPILVPLSEVRWISVVLTWEEYGGPEEGGWTYACGDPVIRVPLIFGQETNFLIEDRLDKWARQYNKDWEPRYYYEKRAVIRYGKVDAYPAERPTYE